MSVAVRAMAFIFEASVVSLSIKVILVKAGGWSVLELLTDGVMFVAISGVSIEGILSTTMHGWVIIGRMAETHA